MKLGYTLNFLCGTINTFRVLKKSPHQKEEKNIFIKVHYSEPNNLPKKRERERDRIYTFI